MEYTIACAIDCDIAMRASPFFRSGGVIAMLLDSFNNAVSQST